MTNLRLIDSACFCFHHCILQYHEKSRTSQELQMFCVCVLLRFIMISYCPILPMSFRVESLALGQSYDCPSASESTLKDIRKHIIQIHSKKVRTKLNNREQSKTKLCTYFMGCTLNLLPQQLTHSAAGVGGLNAAVVHSTHQKQLAIYNWFML